MASQPFESLLHRLCSTFGKRKTDGFTLIELIVSMAIASIAILGLLSLVVQLLEANQRESAQTETQRDMQMALDFISSELREAVYVYGGDCLQGQTAPTWCPGIVNSVPIPTSSVPILAFWKLEPLPKQFFQTNGACTTNPPPTNIPCNSGRTYTLVVYFLSKDNTSINWLGTARITRYTLTQFDSMGNPTVNYVSPNQNSVGFTNWPYLVNGTNKKNLEIGLPTSNATNTAALVDFVDDTARPSVGDDNITCPTNYVLTPSANTLNTCVSSPFSTIDKNIRSFYGCVRGGTIYNQDVFVFLRSNAYGRPGIQGLNSNSFLPTLQTQVFSRGIVNDIPPAL